MATSNYTELYQSLSASITADNLSRDGKKIPLSSLSNSQLLLLNGETIYVYVADSFDYHLRGRVIAVLVPFDSSIGSAVLFLPDDRSEPEFLESENTYLVN
jgi:hypothetical protein